MEEKLHALHHVHCQRQYWQSLRPTTSFSHDLQDHSISTIFLHVLLPSISRTSSQIKSNEGSGLQCEGQTGLAYEPARSHSCTITGRSSCGKDVRSRNDGALQSTFTLLVSTRQLGIRNKLSYGCRRLDLAWALEGGQRIWSTFLRACRVPVVHNNNDWVCSLDSSSLRKIGHGNRFGQARPRGEDACLCQSDRPTSLHSSKTDLHIALQSSHTKIS